ncbi:MAG: hypothetical protein EPN25_13635 [Nitrospirae bacterium]|nr:MAG: hypothetical protein EPN25_13635 [Nitrospirota bacterium]
MRLFCLSTLLLCLMLCLPAAYAAEQPAAGAQPEPQAWVRVSAPLENAEIIGKKPDITAEFLVPLKAGSLVIMVDGTDVTQISEISEKGFTYSPVMVLPPGGHTVSITAQDQNGGQLQKSVPFTIRHTKMFEEAYTQNDLSVVYEEKLTTPEGDTSPRSKVQGNLASETKVKRKELEFNFKTNLRYFDQNTPLAFAGPGADKKGINLVNYLLQGKYTKDQFMLLAEAGDVQINETQNTVSALARRGGRLSLQYNDLSLSAFVVKSENILGFRGGTGITFDDNDHILGASAGIKLLDKKVEFRTIFATGETAGGSSFGFSTVPGRTKGDVLGLLLITDFLQNKLRTEFETDFTSFDPDISDEFGSKKDRAYRLKAGGSIDTYTYEAMYEYFGRDYAVVGNQMIQKDKEGITARAGASFGAHALNLNFSRFNDNVKGDELFPKITNMLASVDYSFSGIQQVPIGFNFQKSIQDSSLEPAGTSPLQMHTGTVTGRIGYTKDAMSINFMTAFSKMDDRTTTNNDTTTATYTLTPAYNTPNLAVNPNFSLNQTKNSVTGVRADTYTISLDLRSKFFKERVTFDVGSTYNITKTSDRLTDLSNLTANLRLGYLLAKRFMGLVNPTLAVRATYMQITDRINHASDRDAFSAFMVLTTAIPFSF